ncbi:hypothetical protein D3C86_1851640 [compost metagenome]
MQTDTAVLLVGQNRGTAERFAQCLTVTEYQLVAAFWQNTLVIREFTVDQFRGEGELAGGGTNVMLTQYDADDAVRLGQQTCKLKDTFARHDDLMAVRLPDIGLHRAHRQTVTVGGHGADDAG